MILFFWNENGEDYDKTLNFLKTSFQVEAETLFADPDPVAQPKPKKNRKSKNKNTQHMRAEPPPQALETEWPNKQNEAHPNFDNLKYTNIVPVTNPTPNNSKTNNSTSNNSETSVPTNSNMTKNLNNNNFEISEGNNLLTQRPENFENQLDEHEDFPSSLRVSVESIHEGMTFLSELFGGHLEPDLLGEIYHENDYNLRSSVDHLLPLTAMDSSPLEEELIRSGSLMKSDLSEFTESDDEIDFNFSGEVLGEIDENEIQEQEQLMEDITKKQQQTTNDEEFALNLQLQEEKKKRPVKILDFGIHRPQAAPPQQKQTSSPSYTQGCELAKEIQDQKSELQFWGNELQNRKKMLKEARLMEKQLKSDEEYALILQKQLEASTEVSPLVQAKNVPLATFKKLGNKLPVMHNMTKNKPFVSAWNNPKAAAYTQPKGYRNDEPLLSLAFANSEPVDKNVQAIRQVFPDLSFFSIASKLEELNDNIDLTLDWFLNHKEETGKSTPGPQGQSTKSQNHARANGSLTKQSPSVNLPPFTSKSETASLNTWDSPLTSSEALKLSTLRRNFPTLPDDILTSMFLFSDRDVTKTCQKIAQVYPSLSQMPPHSVLRFSGHLVPNEPAAPLEQRPETHKYGNKKGSNSQKGHIPLDPQEPPTQSDNPGPETQSPQSGPAKKSQLKNAAFKWHTVSNSKTKQRGNGPKEGSGEQVVIQLRHEVSSYGSLRRKYMQKAAQAFESGNKRAAHEYSLLARKYELLMKSAQMQLCNGINAAASTAPSGNIVECDLHGLTVREAELTVGKVLREAKAKGNIVKFITGLGKHSIGQVPRIKPAVEEFLRTYHFRYYTPHPGAFIVEPDSSWLQF